MGTPIVASTWEGPVLWWGSLHMWGLVAMLLQVQIPWDHSFLHFCAPLPSTLCTCSNNSQQQLSLRLLPTLSAWRTWELRASPMPLARSWQVQEPASPSPGETPPCSPWDHFAWGCTLTWLLPVSHPASPSVLPGSPVSTSSRRHLYRVCCWGPRRSVSSAENELCLKKP